MLFSLLSGCFVTTSYDIAAAPRSKHPEVSFMPTWCRPDCSTSRAPTSEFILMKMVSRCFNLLEEQDFRRYESTMRTYENLRFVTAEQQNSSSNSAVKCAQSVPGCHDSSRSLILSNVCRALWLGHLMRPPWCPLAMTSLQR